MPFIGQNLGNKRKTGTTSVGGTAVPLTKVGDTSSGNTTYANQSVADGSAWDLSAISIGDVAVTQDGYKGLVTAVDDGNDELEIKAWMESGGKLGGQGSGVKPTDGQTVTIHRIAECPGIYIKALFANSDNIRIGLNGVAVATDFPLSKGRSTWEYDPEGNDKVDVTKIFILADTGTQKVAWAAMT